MNLTETRKKMQQALDVLQKDLRGIRTSRANPEFLDSVQVEAYGGRGRLAQYATVSVQDSRTLIVQVWDPSVMSDVQKGIAEAGLGLSPVSEGNTLRLVLPELSEERRLELVKVVSKVAEKTKVALRNVRRNTIDEARAMQKEQSLTKDQLHRLHEDVQKLLNDFIERVDEFADRKEKEILGG